MKRMEEEKARREAEVAKYREEQEAKLATWKLEQEKKAAELQAEYDQRVKDGKAAPYYPTAPTHYTSYGRPYYPY